MELDKVQPFFGLCDREGHNPNGKIVNANPLWTKKKQISDMKESIAEIKQRERENTFISGKARVKMMARREKIETTLKQIEASNPVGKIKGKALDAVQEAVDSFVEEIQNISPSQHEDEQSLKGTSNIDPSMQGHLSKTPCIKLKNEKELKIAELCNMKVENGMVSRDDMKRGVDMLWQVLGQRPDHMKYKREKPYNYVASRSQVTVPELPETMSKAGKNNVFNKK